MKWTAVSLVAGVLLAGMVLAQEPKPAQPKAKESAKGDLASDREKASYGIGLSMGRQFKAQGIDINTDLVARGLKDGLAGTQPLLTDQEIQAAMETIRKELIARQAEMQAKQAEQGKASAAKNQQEGAAFLAANAKKQGITTLPSGLQYKVLKGGNGPTPKATDTVRAHYRGTLIDGTQFDSSYDRGEPLEIGVGNVIPGWTEALQRMKVGSKWQLFIPANLAYGERGAGEDIPPNSTLIFDIELLGIAAPK